MMFSSSDSHSGPKVLVRAGPPDQHVVKTSQNRLFFNIDIKLWRKNCIFLLSKSRHQRACGCFLPFFAGLLDSQDVSPKRLARKTWRQHHDQQVLVWKVLARAGLFRPTLVGHNFSEIFLQVRPELWSKSPTENGTSRPTHCLNG